MSHVHATALFAAFCTANACGGSSATPAADASTDGGDGGTAPPPDASDASSPQDASVPEGAAPSPEASIDATADAAPYPAFAVDVARITDLGGPTETAPAIVTVSWSADTNAAVWEAFGDTIGASSYWHTINSEYSVGAGSSGGHVRIATTPMAVMTNLDVDALVTSGANSTWPAATANTVYAVYLPPATRLYLNGEPDAGGLDPCQTGVPGYHTETQSSPRLVYTVVEQCPGAAVSALTFTASLELNEAATNPMVFTNPAYAGFDTDHMAFELFTGFQHEVGDACRRAVTTPDVTTEPNFAYSVARQWSNASAAAGHDWCVPASSPVFYNTTLLPQSGEGTISVNVAPLGMGGGTSSTRGFVGTLGQALVIPVGLFSDGPTAGPFNLDVDTTWPVVDANGNAIANGSATVSFDHSSGVNGDLVKMTVTPTAWSPLGVVYVAIRSLLPGQSQAHELPILIGQP
jgi:hypothetical protein